jgi:MFS family permease
LVITDAGRADRWRLALASFAVLLAAADTYVVVVVLPNIMAGVGLDLNHLQRAAPIISGFLLGYTAVLPLIGRIADLVGPAPTFVGCLAAFGLGSVVTATSHALAVVIAGRAIQGLGGGGLVPVTLALVADRWPPDRRGRPLGVVGGLQELGSVVGPLYGAGVVAFASWRLIFWVNVPVAVLVGAGFLALRAWDRPAPDRPSRAGRADPVGPLLAVIGLAGLGLGLDAPASLANSVSLGQLYTPEASGEWSGFTTPVVLISLAVLAAAVVWEAAAPALGVRPVLAVRSAGRLLRRSDLPGALLLAGALAGIVVAFSTADPSHQVLASSAPVVLPAAAACAAGFWWRQHRATEPLIEPGSLSRRPAWGGLLVNLSLGGALMAALVDVPLFARVTAYPDSETDAALVLLRFLIAVPVGAVVGGALCRDRGRAAPVAAAGMALATAAFVAMSQWSATALGGGPRWSDVELVAAGLGFGLAIAPVNVAVLGAVESRHHALAGALAVVARTIGMLAGISALTAVALHSLHQRLQSVSALQLCPTHPLNCPAYDQTTTGAALHELHIIFIGAAAFAALATVLAAVLLRPAAEPRPAGAGADPDRLPAAGPTGTPAASPQG